MKTLKLILIVLIIFLVVPAHGQDNDVVPQRTPEQEASKQTEKLQQELNLSSGQARQVYDINLRYARERHVSNKRSEAIQRMKSKNDELQRVMNEDQYNRLQNKRYERSSFELPAGNRNQPANSSGYRSSPGARTNMPARTNSSGTNIRNNARSNGTYYQGRSQPSQILHRNSTVPSRTTRIRSSSSSSSRSQSTTPARETKTPVNSNRR